MQDIQRGRTAHQAIGRAMRSGELLAAVLLSGVLLVTGCGGSQRSAAQEPQTPTSDESASDQAAAKKPSESNASTEPTEQKKDAAKEDPGPDSEEGAADAKKDECLEKRRACTDACKASAADTASRQACYTRCLKEADACTGR